MEDSVNNHNPKHLSTRHRALMRRLLAGQTVSQAATELGMSMGRVSIVSNSPLFKEEMAIMQKEIAGEFVKNESSKVHTDMVRTRLSEEALASLNTIVGLRDGAQSERVRQLSAIEILDRAGFKAPERVEGSVLLDASDGLMSAIQQAMKEMQTPTPPPAVAVSEETPK